MSDDLVERLLDWPYQGETMAHEAADRIKQLTAERDDALECNEQFFVDNQFLKKRVEETRKEWEGWQSAAFKLMGKVTALTAERDEALADLSASQGYIADAIFALDKQKAAEAERDSYRKALEDIIKDYEPGYPLSHDVIKYVARAALKGETT